MREETVGRPWPRPLPARTMRRLGEIGEALEAELGPVELLDPGEFILAPTCEDCGCLLEGGHCYCCRPVWGYGENWQMARHGEEPPKPW